MLGKRTVENGEDSVGKYTQGFLTNKNRFVDRKEGAEIALKQNQIKRLITMTKDNVTRHFITSKDIIIFNPFITPI